MSLSELTKTMRITRGARAQEQAALEVALALSAATTPSIEDHAQYAPRTTHSRVRRPKPPRATPVLATTIKARNPGRVAKKSAKKSAQKSKASSKQTSLIVRLSVKYYNVGPKVLRERFGIKIKREKVVHTNKHRFTLGHNPFTGTSLRLVPADEVVLIYNVFVEHNKKFGFGSFVSQPAHAAQSKPVVTIDSVIQVMLSQTTANELAIDTHDRLRNRYVYLVDGKKYAGLVPNWHKVRLLPEDDLRDALVPGGQFNKRAKAVKELLDFVYNANLARKNLGKGQYEHLGNPPDAKDFVDGMLSMEFITADFPDDSDQAILDRLLKLPNFGSKSAMCILAFQLKRDLFVVDVHVLRFCKWLGWIPKTAKPEDAAMYLHKVIPKDIRYDFHNQIWTHCANENVRESRGRLMVCPFCGSSPPPGGKDFSKVKCLLEPYLPPLEKRWSREYRPKKEDLTDEVKIKDEEAEAEISTTKSHKMEQQTMNALFKTKKTTTAQSAHHEIKQKTPPSSPDSASSKIKPIKEKKLKIRRTMLMEELTPEQAIAHNKFLFMFRPLDNSFGQDRGTFESKPRFRWEGSEIMDPDVAVPYEDAVKVLNGELPHPWMKTTREVAVMQQALGAMVAASAPVLATGVGEETMATGSDEEVEWEATDDELDGETLVDSMDEATWESLSDEDSADETIGEEMRSWQIDNLE